MKVGNQTRIPTPGKNRHYHVIGAYNWATDEIIYTTCKKKNTESFCEFLEHFMEELKGDKPVMYVLDNASYHHSNISEAVIAYFEDKALPVWLPPYCSDLNPIERFWRHMKDNACANRLFDSIDEVVESVTNILNQQNNPFSIDRLVFQKT